MEVWFVRLKLSSLWSSDVMDYMREYQVGGTCSVFYLVLLRMKAWFLTRHGVFMLGCSIASIVLAVSAI